MQNTARQACVYALLEWEKGKVFSDEILHNTIASSRLTPLDRGFLMETFFGILRNLTSLDFLIDCLRQGSLDHPTRAVLRLGIYQIFHLRTAPHAAVNETVSLAGRARGLVNAILRRALREKESLEQRLAKAPQTIRSSHPTFLLDRWNKAFGEAPTEELCRWNNSPAEVHVRANGLKISAGELLHTTPAAEPCPAHPRALKVSQLPFTWMMNGLCYVQDPSTLFACDLLNPQPGETVLDACAAPGGKTTYIAELMQNKGRLIACDLYDSRVARLRENCTRMGVQNATILQHDCMQADGPLAAERFDRILVDAPCSNTGVIRRRVDVRWRLTDEDFLRMPAQQLALLRRLIPLLKPGGSLVYSTCSLEHEENEDVISAALASIPGIHLAESRRILPFVDHIDGAFAARLVRES